MTFADVCLLCDYTSDKDWLFRLLKAVQSASITGGCSRLLNNGQLPAQGMQLFVALAGCNSGQGVAEPQHSPRRFPSKVGHIVQLCHALQPLMPVRLCIVSYGSVASMPGAFCGRSRRDEVDQSQSLICPGRGERNMKQTGHNSNVAMHSRDVHG